MASDGRPHKHVCLTTEVLMCFQGDSDLDDMLSGQSDSILGGNDDAMYDGDSAVHMQANDVTDPAICTREMDSSDSERREVSLLQHKGIVCQSRWWRWWVCWGREQWWWWDDVGEDEGDKNDGKNSGEDDGKDDGDAGGEDDGDGSDRSSSDSTSVAARWNTYRSHLVEAVDKGRVPHEVEVEAVDMGQGATRGRGSVQGQGATRGRGGIRGRNRTEIPKCAKSISVPDTEFEGPEEFHPFREAGPY